MSDGKSNPSHSLRKTHLVLKIEFLFYEVRFSYQICLLEGDTQVAWDLIQKHQFPTDCKNQSYFVGEYWPHGWGSYTTVTHRSLEATTQVRNFPIRNSDMLVRKNLFIDRRMEHLL